MVLPVESIDPIFMKVAGASQVGSIDMSTRGRPGLECPAMKSILLALSCFVAACGGTRQTDISSESPHGGAVEYVAADADFMRNMIGHHAQAIEMTDLVPDRSRSETMVLLARRIDESQVFEIGLMRRWLAARGEEGSAMSHEMAGMATPEQLAELAEAGNEAFDRLFLELMIRHHEGALVMVDALVSAEGGGQELEVFQLISHIDADQRAEIARMQRMLNELQ